MILNVDQVSISQKPMYDYRPGQIIIDRYELVKQLPSKHKYCSLFKAFKTNKTRDHVFLKIIDKKAFFEGTTFSDSDKKLFISKIKKGYKKMASNSSNCIAKCYACKESETSIFIELQDLNGANLLDLAKKYNGFSFNDALIILKQVILCLQALQQNQEHLFGNLRMSHFVYNCGLLKLCNLGYTHIRREKKLLNDQENYLTEPQLFAPELISNEDSGNKKSDIWCLGALFFVLLNWKRYNGIFTHQDIFDFIQGKKQTQIERIISKSLKTRPEQRVQLIKLKEEISNLVNKEQLPVTLFIFPKNKEKSIIFSQFSTKTINKENLSFSSFENSQSNKEIEEKMQKEGQSYKQALKLYTLIQRCEYFYKKIIKQIEDSLWAKRSLNNKQFKQTMYLFYARIFSDMSNIRIEVQKLQCKQIKQDFEKYFKYAEISNMFDRVSQELTQYENTFLERFIFNPFNYLFKGKQKQKRDKFLIGVQNIDFNRGQQIQFTVEYINQIFDFYKKNSDCLSFQLYERLKLYQEIINYQQSENIFDYFGEKISKKFR